MLHAQELCNFGFCPYVDFKINLLAHIRYFVLSVLTDEHYDSEKNRLERNKHREKAERERIEGFDAVESEIPLNPSDKENRVPHEEPERTELLGEDVRDFVCPMSFKIQVRFELLSVLSDAVPRRRTVRFHEGHTTLGGCRVQSTRAFSPLRTTKQKHPVRGAFARGS